MGLLSFPIYTSSDSLMNLEPNVIQLWLSGINSMQFKIKFTCLGHAISVFIKHIECSLTEGYGYSIKNVQVGGGGCLGGGERGLPWGWCVKGVLPPVCF